MNDPNDIWSYFFLWFSYLFLGIPLLGTAVAVGTWIGGIGWFLKMAWQDKLGPHFKYPLNWGTDPRTRY